MSQEMIKKEYGVCVDLTGSKEACGKSLLVKIWTEGPPNFYTVMLQQKASQF